ncbi:MAG TPA: translation initiation factor IF-2 N-terminal domain-containing protein, partial [Gemmataceae bacterium]|nr:translation initiation factor IF-2 N-terminal domain-containing protein [Gemmataceae bacterium]
MQDKIRIYALARELNVETKDLIDTCRQAGIDVKNQLSSLDPDQRDMVVKMLKGGGGTATATAVATPPRSAAPVIPQVMTPVPVLHGARPARREPEPKHTAPPAGIPKPVPAAKTPEEPVAQPPSAAPPTKIPLTPAARAPEPAAPPPTQTPVSKPPDMSGKAPDAAAKAPVPASKVPDLGQRPPDVSGRARAGRIPRPQAVVRVAKPPLLKRTPPKVDQKPAEPAAQKPLMKLTAEMQEKFKGPGAKAEDILRKAAGDVPVVPVDIEEEDDGKGKRPGVVTGRDKRHAARNERAKQRKDRQDELLRGGGKLLLQQIDDDRPLHLKNRLHKVKRPQAPTQPRKGKPVVEVPITVRALSEAVALKSGDLLLRLAGHGMANVNINSIIDPELAEMLALEVGVELEVKRPADSEDKLLAELQQPDQPEDLLPRAPIVTIMGHVDHGKTTLLDKIRLSNIAATEAGGITQVIRAWRVEHNGHFITFLDTPGHEAFTKMRARGAQVTDIAVIVVAADDGVMPQTEEAINHARAAGVSIVIAINKIDIPNANVDRTRRQLYALNLLPDNMGGDIPFVETSAVKGKGIDLLL